MFSNKSSKYEKIIFFLFLQNCVDGELKYFIVIGGGVVGVGVTPNISPAHFMIITITLDWTNVTAGHLEDVL